MLHFRRKSQAEFEALAAELAAVVSAAATEVGPAGVVPPPPSVPAGWYPNGDVQRYWDGSVWTDHTAPLG